MASLVPFVSPETGLKHDLAQEYSKAAGNLETAGIQQDPTTHGPSGSNWGIKEVHSVRAVPLVDVDSNRIVPEEYFRDDTNEAFVSLRREIRKASIDDLKAFDDEKFLGNPFRIFFEYLSELCTTNTSEDSINRAYHRRTSIDSNTTEMSTSSAEGKDEGVSTGALKEFIKDILPMMGDDRRLPTGQNDSPFQLNSFAATTRLEFQVAGTKHIAANDGSIGMNLRGSASDPIEEVKCP